MSVSHGIEPLYIKNSDLSLRDLKPYDICQAMVRVVGTGKVDGAQRVKNIWRLYLKDRKARADLFVKQTILINGKNTQLYDQNPMNVNPRFQKPSDKVTVKDIPLEISNDEIKVMLESVGAILISPIKDSYERDVHGNMTSFKNGDRFAYIQALETPLKRNMIIGAHTATIIHHGKDNRPCQACNQTGHKLGSDNCPALPKTPIYVFKSFQHPMSNHYPCNLVMFGQEFKSFEHVLFWRMALGVEKPYLAFRIKDAKHAGVAKSMNHEMTDDERHKWEDENEDVIKDMLFEKFKQVQEFRQCLIDNQGKQFAEAGRSMRWATGLGPYITERTDPEYWPGKIFLGKTLTDMSLNVEVLLKECTEHNTPGYRTPPLPACSGFPESTLPEQIEQIISKKHISACRIKHINPDYNMIIQDIKEIYTLEKHIAQKHNLLTDFNTKWIGIEQLFQI